MQRRHQKVVEEAPAPASPTRCASSSVSAVCAPVSRSATAVRVPSSSLYENGEFYFIEMNTRIQVEHPVTEMVTGVDLIKEQLRIAAGQPLSITQGHPHPWPRHRVPDQCRRSGHLPALSRSHPALPRAGRPGRALGIPHLCGLQVPLLRLHDRQADLLRENRDVAIARMRHSSTSWWWKGSRPTSPCKKEIMKDENFQHGGTNIHYPRHKKLGL